MECSGGAAERASLTDLFGGPPASIACELAGGYPSATKTFDPLAQSVEHLPFKQGVAGSIPARVTIVWDRLPLHPLAPTSKLGLSDVDFRIVETSGDC